ncbi:J domain-containing protein [Acidicapsa dinghuensis]|uniref:J domain-containing protein n=1 Tax=Acidicapsa dinghuensis TaxID=2218256 RepID=A0ABW1EDH4_9BACT|nr:J domain-containing protein [Acidicapsa dinghuensis]
MSCSCVQCRIHGATLGLKKFPASRRAIHQAYRRAAMAWHPDRFASEPGKMHEAEEHFKQAQSAYRELAEHNPETQDEPEIDDATADVESVEEQATEAAPNPSIQWNSIAPSVLFANISNCFVPPDLPPSADAVVSQHLSFFDYPNAIFDLAYDGSFRRFFLLASHGAIFKDSLGKVALLRYEDFGQVELLNRESDTKRGFWDKLGERIVSTLAEHFHGVPERFSLDLYRGDGTHFCSLTGLVTDEAKSAIYRYLVRKKQQFQREESGLVNSTPKVVR